MPDLRDIDTNLHFFEHIEIQVFNENAIGVLKTKADSSTVPDVPSIKFNLKRPYPCKTTNCKIYTTYGLRSLK